MDAVPETESVLEKETDTVGKSGNAVGNFVLCKMIDRGGMGEIWLAKNKWLGERFQVVIKIHNPKRTDLTIDNEYMRREVEFLLSIKSPFVVQVLDCGTLPTDAEHPYYSMEYLDGDNMDNLVVAGGPVSPCIAVIMLSYACDALAAVHKAGVIHRDVKPGNLFVCKKTLSVKLIDFGLAWKNGVPEPHEKYCFGSPHFMSPEMISGKTVSETADIYGLGCVAYWLLSGNYVFGGSLQRIFSCHVSEQPAPLNVTRNLNSLVMSCLAKNPGDRPQAKDLGEMLLGLKL